MSKVYKSVPPNYIYTWSTRIWLAESRMNSSMQHKHLLLLTMHCSLCDQTLFHVIPLFHQIIWQSYQQQEWEAEVKVCSNCEIIHLNKWTAPPCSFFCFLTRGLQLEDSHVTTQSSFPPTFPGIAKPEPSSVLAWWNEAPKIYERRNPEDDIVYQHNLILTSIKILNIST